MADTHPLLERARREGTPLLDGDRATFVWEGDQAPNLIGDFNGWGWGEPVKLTQIAPDVWVYTLTLPRDAYMEYSYVLNGERFDDPFNARTLWNGIDAKNSYFYMPELQPNPFVERRRGVRRGKVSRHVAESELAVVGGKRGVLLYQPPTDEPCPLVVVFDGPDYMQRAHLTTMVDNLIAEKRIRPIALAMLAHGRQARIIEYMSNDATLIFLVGSVLPLAREHLNLVDTGKEPGAYGVLGASMGGLMALYAGLRLPDIFGRVISQSAALAFGDEQGHEMMIFDLVRWGEVKPVKIWMDVGKFEQLLQPVRRMHGLLKDRGYDVTYREFGGGHNYAMWADNAWRALETLYRAKL